MATSLILFRPNLTSALSCVHVYATRLALLVLLMTGMALAQGTFNSGSTGAGIIRRTTPKSK